MKAAEKEMSVGTQRFLGKTIVGILWIGIGIVGCLTSVAAKVIHILLLCLAIAIAVFLLKVKGEDDDEMSEENYTKAKAKAHDIMYFIFCSLTVVSALVCGLLKNAGIAWYRVIPYMFFVLMGIQDILTGVFFHRLEAE